MNIKPHKTLTIIAFSLIPFVQGHAQQENIDTLRAASISADKKVVRAGEPIEATGLSGKSVKGNSLIFRQKSNVLWWKTPVRTLHYFAHIQEFTLHGRKLGYQKKCLPLCHNKIDITTNIKDTH